ncbi:MAG TPA: DUF402 domain-containing protein [Micromonosporaceae bacterium]|jgi:hypothetical protein
MPFARGEIIVRRYFRGTHLTWANAAAVVSDDTGGLRLWVPVGAAFARRVDEDGRPIGEVPVDAFGAARMEVTAWAGQDVLILMPPGAEYSVWWFFAEGTFTGWYVNLEERAVRWPGGVDTMDRTLDVRVSPDRTWAWKDEAEFQGHIGADGYWDADGAATIRDEAERIVKLVQAGEFPFDGTWCDFRPDPAWPVPASLPLGWDRRRATP